ncbi:(Fe-S)-binding protein [Desulfitobacterium chlororespirans]|uniref:Glycolate oxidase iron-sulfur subunit n=1 Tax=Desulfitobacterium chlororespirans DSM 11544 TaxID=1121395 RepID=A0A1M7U9T6_9FIRM|nr:(Fe-S)-binding protein [Desulfitobacterium chlororespirans]SHN79695.1 glycolate oxidase iron-sulfur subunit [Desulfitobacterium chlororespirans DSM 11544]
MSIYSSLDSIQDELNKCMKCGNCQEVCPIYKENRREVSVARGKISLVQMVMNGEVEMTEGIADRLSLCTTCMACNKICPCGVRFDKIILAARAEAVRKKGLHPVKKIAFTALKANRLFDFGMKMGSTFQGLAMKRVHGSDKGARLRIDIGIGKEKILPNLASRPLKDELPEVTKVKEPKMRVGYYIGCMTNYFYTDMGKAVVDVLKENDCEIVVPKDQGCCGTPAAVNGDVESAKACARRNLLAFEKLNPDVIISNCSSCGEAWKHTFPQIFEEDSEMKALADKWAARTYDIAEFLIHKVPYKKEGLGPVQRKVTYHDPCHLNRGQGVNQEPREILNSIPGLEFIEMKKPDRCCGMAGSFYLVHPDLSGQIGAKKIADIAQTHTDTVVTGCPACRLQLTSGVMNAGLHENVMHTVQILAESYQAGKKGAKQAAR